MVTHSVCPSVSPISLTGAAPHPSIPLLPGSESQVQAINQSGNLALYTAICMCLVLFLFPNWQFHVQSQGKLNKTRTACCRTIARDFVLDYMLKSLLGENSRYGISHKWVWSKVDGWMAWVSWAAYPSPDGAYELQQFFNWFVTETRSRYFIARCTLFYLLLRVTDSSCV